MLESKVDQEDNQCEDDRGHQDQQCRILQLFPGGPGHLLGELLSTLLQIVYELSHLCLQWANGKIGSGNSEAFS